MRMTGRERLWIGVAGASGAAAVAIGAAGRHLLSGEVYRQELAATGAHYALVHAVALLGVAALSTALGMASGAARHWLAGAGWCFAAGLVLFPGSLYLRAAGLLPAVAPATPIGGSLFILGWLALAGSALVGGRRARPLPAAEPAGSRLKADEAGPSASSAAPPAP